MVKKRMVRPVAWLLALVMLMTHVAVMVPTGATALTEDIDYLRITAPEIAALPAGTHYGDVSLGLWPTKEAVTISVTGNDPWFRMTDYDMALRTYPHMVVRYKVSALTTMQLFAGQTFGNTLMSMPVAPVDINAGEWGCLYEDFSGIASSTNSYARLEWFRFDLEKDTPGVTWVIAEILLFKKATDATNYSRVYCTAGTNNSSAVALDATDFVANSSTGYAAAHSTYVVSIPEWSDGLGGYYVAGGRQAILQKTGSDPYVTFTDNPSVIAGLERKNVAIRYRTTTAGTMTVSWNDGGATQSASYITHGDIRHWHWLTFDQSSVTDKEFFRLDFFSDSTADSSIVYIGEIIFYDRLSDISGATGWGGVDFFRDTGSEIFQVKNSAGTCTDGRYAGLQKSNIGSNFMVAKITDRFTAMDGQTWYVASGAHPAHDSDTVVAIPATGEANGSVTTTCSLCGENKTVTVTKLVRSGDINGDGSINARDMVRMSRYIAGDDVEVDQNAMDTNGDSAVNSKDLTRLSKYFAGSGELHEYEVQVSTDHEVTPEPAPETVTFFDGSTHMFTLETPSDAILSANAADYQYMKTVISEFCGGTAIPEYTGDKQVIRLTYAGEPMDYAVTIDPFTLNVTLSGGSSAALQKAIYIFTGSYLRVNSNGTVDLLNTGNYVYDHSEDQIDNSSFLSYISSDQVTLSLSNGTGGSNLMSPEWVDTLVMAQVRIDTASIGGTFAESYDLLDYYAEMGVNGILLNPIYEFGSGNGYGNNGPHTVAPHLTGTNDYAQGWQEVKKFVDYAHSKGIYVLFDIISWGTNSDAPLVSQHPDWFSGTAWGGAAFNWSNSTFVEWFISTCVQNILVTGADGYRCDCEPNYSGYDVYYQVRQRLAAQGKYIMVIAEDRNSRNNTYEMEQDGALAPSIDRGTCYVNGYNMFVDGYLDIVNASMTGNGLASGNGAYRYYTNCISNHDYQTRSVRGNRLKIGYAAILAPYIPLWFQGEEFIFDAMPGVQYFNPVDYSLLDQPANALFVEDVKNMIRIRRTYSGLFEYWPLSHTNTNLCGVTVSGSIQSGSTARSAYARYAHPDNPDAPAGTAVLVIPNNVSESSGVAKVTIPVEGAKLWAYSQFTVTDLSTGRVIATVSASDPTFTVAIPYTYSGMYLIQGS